MYIIYIYIKINLRGRLGIRVPSEPSEVSFPGFRGGGVHGYARVHASIYIYIYNIYIYIYYIYIYQSRLYIYIYYISKQIPGPRKIGVNGMSEAPK